MSLSHQRELIWGISVTADPTFPGRAISPVWHARRSTIDAVPGFRVHDTPLREDPFHRTVEIPNPVTREVADQWNAIFGIQRIRRR